MDTGPRDSDFTVHRGATRPDPEVWEFVGANAAAVPLAGYDFVYTCREAVNGVPSDAAPVAFRLTPGAGLTVDAAAGRVTFALTLPQADALRAGGDYFYDLRVAQADGKVYRLPADGPGRVRVLEKQ